MKTITKRDFSKKSSIWVYLMTLFLCLLALLVTAQPGGGGGLNISAIYNMGGELMEMNSPHFKMNHFVLGKNGKKVEYIFDTLQKETSNYYTSGRKWLYLPPDYLESEKKCPNQRLEIIYKKDTMTIDFIGISMNHAQGASEQIDAIYFFPGKYKMHRMESDRYLEIQNSKSIPADQKKKVEEAMHNWYSAELRNWQLLEEEYNPKKRAFLQKYFRENCEEEMGTRENYRLCEQMMSMEGTIFQVKTIQKPLIKADTSIYRFTYYYSFTNPLLRKQILNEDADKKADDFPYEEEKLASSYLDAFETKTLYLKGSLYSGIIEIRISTSGFSGVEQTVYHYCYSNGVFKKKYICPDLTIKNVPARKPQ